MRPQLPGAKGDLVESEWLCNRTEPADEWCSHPPAKKSVTRECAHVYVGSADFTHADGDV